MSLGAPDGKQVEILRLFARDEPVDETELMPAGLHEWSWALCDARLGRQPVKQAPHDEYPVTRLVQRRSARGQPQLVEEGPVSLVGSNH